MTTNFRLDQGTTFAKIITIQDANGTAINLSGATIRGQMRTTYAAAYPVATFTGAVTDAAHGIGSISLTAAETSAIPAGTYLYDVEWVTEQGVVTRILEGKITVRPEVTK